MVVKISKRNRLVLSEDIFKQCTKFSISRIASMKSHRYSPLKLVVPTGPTASLLFTPLLMLFPNVRPESVLCSRVGTVPVQPVSHGSHRAIFSNWPLPTPLPQGGLQAPHNDGCPPHPAWLSPRFLGSARPSVENCATSTYSVQIWSIFKDVLNVKWANGLRCPAWNVDNHYFHLVKFFLSEITSYGICNFVFEVSGKISHSFIDIFAKRIIIEG